MMTTNEPLLDLTVGEALRRATAWTPERAALVSGVPEPDLRRRWTYAELLTDAERTARALLTRYRPGDRIAVWAPNLPEYVVLQFGIALAGMTMVTVNPAYRPAELQFALARSEARAVFLLPQYRSNPMAESLNEVRPNLPELDESWLLTEFERFLADGSSDVELPPVDPGDPMALLYTSGTTGNAKGAVIHHRAMVNGGHLVAQGWAGGEHEININPLPFFHIGGCVLGILGAVTTCATFIPMVAFNPGLALELIEAEHATTFAGVPTMFIAMAEHPDVDRRDLSTLKAVGSGGAPLASPVLHRLESGLGVPCINVFGQTEGLVATMTTPGDTFDRRANTVGRPLPHIEVRIVDPEGNTLEAGEVGEVCVRSFSVMLGYDKLPEATAEAVDPNGWLHTGDLGSLDELGYLRIEGRLRDMVIRGGENIYPAEVEAVLVSHPSVGDAAVVGVPDERWGEQLVAFIRPAPDCTPQVDELAELVREKLAHFKVPTYWEMVDEYPITPSGKIKKVELRERWINARQGGKRRSEGHARRQGE